MNCTRNISSTTVLSRRSAASIIKAINGSHTAASRPILVAIQQHATTPPQRQFSTSKSASIKEFFPAPDAPHIKITPPAWPHPIYTNDEMKAVQIAHRDAETMSDKVALSMVRLLRWGLDLATGYKHDKAVALNNKDPAAAHKKYGMTERKYMIRNVFLESVAAVPGMVAAMLRHLHSIRRMKRDNGWIETLLEESFNERMHLLTFLKMVEPGWFMRVMVLGAQGVFFNAFFFSYLLSPKTCHRFVGYLEEEAVITYTRELADLDAGRLPKWAQTEAPAIAINYWNMPEGHRSMRDLLLYIRADEAKHREVNHTLGNLDQKNDPNPFVSEFKDVSKPHPSKSIQYLRATGWERNEVV